MHAGCPHVPRQNGKGIRKQEKHYPSFKLATAAYLKRSRKQMSTSHHVTTAHFSCPREDLSHPPRRFLVRRAGECTCTCTQDQDHNDDQHRDSIAMFSLPRTAVHLAQLPSRLTSPLRKHTFRPSPHHQCVRAVAQPFMQLPVHGLHLNCWPYRDTCRRNGDHGPATALACEALIN